MNDPPRPDLDHFDSGELLFNVHNLAYYLPSWPRPRTRDLVPVIRMFVWAGRVLAALVVRELVPHLRSRPMCLALELEEPLQMRVGGCDEVGQPKDENPQVRRGVLAKVLTLAAARLLDDRCEIQTPEVGEGAQHRRHGMGRCEAGKIGLREFHVADVGGVALADGRQKGLLQRLERQLELVASVQEVRCFGVEELADAEELGGPADFGITAPVLGQFVAVQLIALDGVVVFCFDDDPLFRDKEELVDHFSDLEWETQKAQLLSAGHASFQGDQGRRALHIQSVN